MSSRLEVQRLRELLVFVCTQLKSTMVVASLTTLALRWEPEQVSHVFSKEGVS